MLDPQDLTAVSAEFGVAEEQVRRDHLIGHMLHAIAGLELPLVFFGGTALTWTHLPTGRLSEDIDLYAADRPAAARSIEQGLPRHLRREFPGAWWEPPLTSVRSTDPARLRTPDGLVVRVQLLDIDRQGWHHFPTERRRLCARYRDVPDTDLATPTLAGFAAMKTLAWADRRAARDLFDLAGLSEHGALGKDAAEIFRRSTGRRLAPHDFDQREPKDWTPALRHQTGHLPSARECLASVRSAYGAVLGWS